MGQFRSIIVFILFITLSSTTCDIQIQTEGKSHYDLLVLTVATDQNDGFDRFIRSSKLFGIKTKVLGMNQEWLGGDIENLPGGGQKVNFLVKEMEEWKGKENLIVMFVDSYDVIFTTGPVEIINKFLQFKSKILFGAEDFCWPDVALKSRYPVVEEGKKYLNSGGFMGFAPDIYKLVSYRKIENHDDDQLFYTMAYLDTKMREELSMKLDHMAHVFQNLNGATDEVDVRFDGSRTWIANTEYGTEPCVIHGNGPSKIYLMHLANYVPSMWSQSAGCLGCKENTISLKGVLDEDLPKVTLALFIEKATPFIPEFLKNAGSLNYPKNRMNLFIHNVEPYHATAVDDFLNLVEKEYNSVVYISHRDVVSETAARNMAIEECQKKDCDYLFVIDGDVTLTNQDTLRILIKQNRSVIGPALTKHEKLWSNFWGAIGSDGFYARSPDYLDIVQKRRRGVWNVPFLSSSYLIQARLLPGMKDAYTSNVLDPDMAWCKKNRANVVFMYVENLHDFGWLKETDSYTTEHLHNDMFQIFDNNLDWVAKYLHPNYTAALNSKDVLNPCPDVYWFPIMSETFCKHLIEECEHLDQWSAGKNDDPRLAGGYENVPTVDTHMKQLNFEAHWLKFLKDYIVPMATKLFMGYYSEGRAIMNFVVKYNPKGQYFLRPHHDSSTYTINVALTRPGIDYEGGGCRFLRYNCKVTDHRLGWTVMHPGRLTHYHEGLPVTNGTRYIMVSFIDP